MKTCQNIIKIIFLITLSFVHSLTLKKIKSNTNQEEVEPGWVGGNTLWAVDQAGKIFNSNSGTWKQVDGPVLKFITVAENGRVWGCGPENEIYYRDPGASHFVQINGRLRNLSVSPNGSLYGTDTDGYVFVRFSDKLPQWHNLPSHGLTFRQIALNGNDWMWALQNDNVGRIFSRSSQSGWFSGMRNAALKQITCRNGICIGVAFNNTIWQYNPQHNVRRFEQVQGYLAFIHIHNNNIIIGLDNNGHVWTRSTTDLNHWIKMKGQFICISS